MTKLSLLLCVLWALSIDVAVSHVHPGTGLSEHGEECPRQRAYASLDSFLWWQSLG